MKNFKLESFSSTFSINCCTEMTKFHILISEFSAIVLRWTTKKRKRIRKERKKIGLVAGLPSSQPIHHPFIGQPMLYIPSSTINTGVIDVIQLYIGEATLESRIDVAP